MTIEQLFFELIRVAIGSQNTLSRPPSVKEWQLLYDMAKKQSLVGICFSGVQKMYNDNDNLSNPSNTSNLSVSERSRTRNLPEALYLQWMGMAAKIQQRNEVVNRQCKMLHKEISSSGLTYCIIKGQSISNNYPDQLIQLRQSGDIDVWITAPDTTTLNWVKEKWGLGSFDYHHVNAHVFPDTEVEIHFRPTISRNIIRDRLLSKWYCNYENQVLFDEKLGYCIAPRDFNIVFLLHHIYWHFFSEGCGLRQLMDLNFVLKSATSVELRTALQVVEKLHMKKMASAVMWILGYCFGLPESNMVCSPNPKIGLFLLNEIMQSGNMGHYDERKLKLGKNKLAYLIEDTIYGFRLFRHFSMDVMWIPFGMMYVSLQGKRIRYNYRRNKL